MTTLRLTPWRSSVSVSMTQSGMLRVIRSMRCTTTRSTLFAAIAFRSRVYAGRSGVAPLKPSSSNRSASGIHPSRRLARMNKRHASRWASQEVKSVPSLRATDCRV